MKGAFALLLLIALSAWSQPIYRNFFTTNPAPVVQVTAGTNATITFTLTGTDTRSYRVDIPYQTWLTNGFPWGVLYDPIGAALAATNGYPWTNIPASTIAASNVFSGGQIQQGTLFDVNTNEAGWLLSFSGGNRHRTWNGSGLTNIPIASIIGAPTTNGFVDATVTNGLLVANGGIATNLTIYGDAQRTNSWTYSATGATATNTGYAIGESRSINSTGNTWTVTGTGTGTVTLGTNGTLYATRFSGSGSNLTDIAASISTSGASNQLAFFSFNGASVQWENPARTIYIYQDFRSGRAGGSMWNYANGGSGGTSSSATYTLDGFPCADDFYFYVNASPSWSTYNTLWRFGKSAGSVEVWELGVKTGSYLSTGTNLYMMIVGANDNNGSGSYPANGAFFQYNGVTNTWQCVLAKSSSYSTNYTSVANVASSNFRFTIISDASTNVTWYINGTLVATVSTASLSPAVGLGGMVLGQSSGTGGFATINDPFLGFVAFYQKLGTSR